MKGTFLFASLSGSLTAEAAVVVSIFMICMISLLQFSGIYRVAVKYSAAMAQTAEEIAGAAYVSAFGDGGWDAWNAETGSGSAGSGGGSGTGNGSGASGSAGSGNSEGAGGSLAGSILTVAYAQGSIGGRVSADGVIKNPNFLFSTFLEKEDRIDLVLTYQARTPFGFVSFPGTVFLQKACVRAWTGRGGSEGSGDDSGQSGSSVVYVAEYGQVYHTDEQCTHIKLSISVESRVKVDSMRNMWGEKYHKCERCNDEFNPLVYITKQGDRYHSSMDCSGLKRTVKEVDQKEAAKNLRPCSKCAGGKH
ncbi:MAG: hypothetical protein Q4B59_05620 [Lachnospiraceae bacterium]|nr:hypothetical protein [Lachnospiraceae bacterium]